jgi:SsrA-binding protein
MSKSTKPDSGIKSIARNKRAFHDYEILEQVEAGLVLQGTEVKSLRAGQVSFQDAHARLRADEMWLFGLHIATYSHGNITNHVPDRPRKVLLHRREIRKLAQKVDRQGLTLVPLELYFRRGFAKLALGVGRGRKKADKRQELKKKDAQRQMDRHVRGKDG